MAGGEPLLELQRNQDPATEYLVLDRSQSKPVAQEVYFTLSLARCSRHR